MKKAYRAARTTPENFWAEVRGNDSECWEWPGPSSYGYGKVSYKSKNWYTHRLAFFFHHGREPNGFVLHSCDNRLCCNPTHLREGDVVDNARDMVERNRAAKGERNAWSKLTDEKVRELRKMRNSGASFRELGMCFGVSGSAAKKVVDGKTWGHVQMEKGK